MRCWCVCRLMVQKLNSQMRQKDEKLVKLREAIKELEARLKEVLKRNADEVRGAGNTQQLAELKLGNEGTHGILLHS